MVRKRRKPAGTDRGGFMRVEAPFVDLDAEQRNEALADIAAASRTRFAETNATIRDALASAGRIDVLVQVAMHLFGLQGRAGLDAPPEVVRINQHHLELLQAIALQAPADQDGHGRVAAAVEIAMKAVHENAEAFQLQTLSGLVDSDASGRLKLAQNQIRGDTQMVRGEFHPHQTDRYLRALFERLDSRFEHVHGVAATTLLDLQSGLLSLVERKIGTWRRSVSRIRREHKPARALKVWAKEFGGDDPDAMTSMQAKAAAMRVAPEHLTAFLIEEACLALREVYAFDLRDVDALLPEGVDRSAVERSLGSWSLAFGDLADADPAHFYLANPVWTRPFVRLGEGRYLWPSPGTTIAFAFDMFETLIDADQALKTAYETARAKLLEAELGRLVSAAFPGADVFTGIRWTSDEDGKAYETDAAVVIDKTLLIFEAKAGRISATARRGSDARLKREVAKLMADPAEQSSRLERQLRTRPGVHVMSANEGEARIDPSRIDTIIRYNITFNILGALSSRWPDLVEAGLIAPDLPYTPTMSVADFDVVTELLEGPAEVVHYLRRRAAFEQNAVYVADEYDLVAFYLDTGFNIGVTEYDGTYLGIYGMSALLDEWFSRRAPGQPPPKKPRPRRTHLWQGLLRQLGTRRPPGWIEMSHRLLDVDFEVQGALEQAMSQMRRQIQRSRKPVDMQTANVSNPTIPRRSPAVFAIYKATSRAERDDLFLFAGAELVERADTEDCLVIGFNVNEPADRYSEIGIVTRPSDATPAQPPAGA